MTAEKTTWGRQLTLTHVYILGVLLLAALTAILISQRGDMLHMGRDVVELDRARAELCEQCRTLESRVGTLRSVAALRSALETLDIELQPRPIAPVDELAPGDLPREGPAR